MSIARILLVLFLLPCLYLPFWSLLLPLGLVTMLRSFTLNLVSPWGHLWPGLRGETGWSCQCGPPGLRRVSYTLANAGDTQLCSCQTLSSSSSGLTWHCFPSCPFPLLPLIVLPSLPILHLKKIKAEINRKCKAFQYGVFYLFIYAFI